jgi:cytoskeletal protein CcmA (bactofilin family)
MKKNKGLKKNTSDMVTLVGINTSFHGKLSGSENICIDGSFEGEIDSQGNVYINQHAQVKAEIVAQNVFINGEINGNIWAKESLDIGETGKIYGDIKTQRLVVAPGGVLRGHSSMDTDEMPEDHDLQKNITNVLDEGDTLDHGMGQSKSFKDDESFSPKTSKSDLFTDLIDTVKDDQ